MRKPRISILGVKHFPSQGAVGRIVEDLLTRIKDRYDFTLYCMTHEDAENHIEGVNVVQFPELPGGAAGVFLFYARCALHLLMHGKPDLVHVHKTDAAFTLPFLTRKFKVIAMSHEAPYRRDKWNRPCKTFFRRMEKIFIGSKAKLTCISKPLCDYYLREYGRPVEFVPNCVENSHPDDKDSAERILREHGIEGDFIFMAGRRIIATKGAHHLLEALNKLEYKGSVVIAGDMGQVRSYTKKIRELARSLDVNFIGFVSGKPTLMALIRRAEYFVFPSETEGMSIMLLEVASVGTPLICSDIPENTAVFAPEEVLYFRNKDAGDLAEKLRWAFGHHIEMEDKAERARRRVIDDYNPGRVVEKYIKLYDGMLPAELVPPKPAPTRMGRTEPESPEREPEGSPVP